MEELWTDLAYSARKIRGAPGFAAAVIATLALGIATTTAIFSVVNGVLLQPLPYPESNRIVQLFQVTDKGNRESVSQPNFHDWEDLSHSFNAMALTSAGYGYVTFTTGSEPILARFSPVTSGFFNVFGVRPEIGRLPSADETRFGGPPTMLVSDRFWREKLGATPAVLGLRFGAFGLTYRVIGVMPSNMTFPNDADVWAPLELFEPNRGRSSQGYLVVARVRPGVLLETAQRELSRLSRQLKLTYGNETRMSDAMLVPLRDQLVGKARPALLVLFGASAFLLLIACANAVNLLIARLAVRDTELAVRQALGASATRLVRQLVAECFSLAAIAGVLGVIVAVLAVRVMLAVQSNLPRAADVHVDLRVVGFAVGLIVLAAVILGWLVGWHGTRRDIRETLSASQRSMAGSGSRARLRRGLVIAQMALTVILLVGAALLGRSFLRLLDVNPGFRKEHLVIADATAQNGTDAEKLAYYTQLVDRTRAIPGVEASGASSGIPLLGGCPDGFFLVLGSPTEHVTIEDWTRTGAAAGRGGHASYCVVDGDYFGTMGIPLVRGRAFGPQDAATSAQVAVVSESFARRTWPDQNPIGRIVDFGNMDGDYRPFTVIGVVGDVRDESLSAEPTPFLYSYLPQRRSPWGMTLVAQTAGDPGAVISSIRSLVRDLQRGVAVQFHTMDRVIASSVADRRFALVLVLVFGSTALLLATLGIYSVVSFLVTQRQREIGVRIALGAQRANVIGLVLREGGAIAVIGVVAGTAGALLLTRLIRSMVYGVSATDPIAFVAVVVLLAAVALTATYLPARRAARVDPMETLRAS